MTRVDFDMWKNTGSDHTDTFHRRKQKKKNKKNKGCKSQKSKTSKTIVKGLGKKGNCKANVDSQKKLIEAPAMACDTAAY